MHRIKLTRAHLQVGSMIGPAQIKFTTEDGGELEWSGCITRADEPVILEVPGDGQLFVAHSQLESVSFEWLDHKEPPCGALE